MQIASTNNASPLPFTPATPSGGNATAGENSPFAKMLSAQKQPGERPPEVQQQGNEKKPAQAKNKAGEKASDRVAGKDAGKDAGKTARKTADKAAGTVADEPQESDAAGDAASTAAAAHRGSARNQPRIELRGRESTIGKLPAKPTADAAEASKPEVAKDAEKKDVATQPGAADIAAHMNQPAASPQPVAAAAGDAAVPPTDGVAKAAPSVGDPAGTLAMAAASPEAAVSGKDRDGSRADALDAKRVSTFEQALKAEAGVGTRESIGEKVAGAKQSQEQRFELPGTHEVHAASHVSAAQAATSTDAPAAPVSVDVPTPITSPDFNEAMGVQVSVLARDGVQHAQLHLNPAEMGPVSVQIALDGTKAQVDFGADSLATRQILESGLPQLASALRDAGFTLAGGGVSQHSQPRQHEHDGAGQGGSMASRRVGGVAEAAATVQRAAAVKMSQGGVDLYA